MRRIVNIGEPSVYYHSAESGSAKAESNAIAKLTLILKYHEDIETRLVAGRELVDLLTKEGHFYSLQQLAISEDVPKPIIELANQQRSQAKDASIMKLVKRGRYTALIQIWEDEQQTDKQGIPNVSLKPGFPDLLAQAIRNHIDECIMLGNWKALYEMFESLSIPTDILPHIFNLKALIGFGIQQAAINSLKICSKPDENHTHRLLHINHLLQLARESTLFSEDLRNKACALAINMCEQENEVDILLSMADDMELTEVSQNAAKDKLPAVVRNKIDYHFSEQHTQGAYLLLRMAKEKRFDLVDSSLRIHAGKKAADRLFEFDEFDKLNEAKDDPDLPQQVRDYITNLLKQKARILAYTAVTPEMLEKHGEFVKTAGFDANKVPSRKVPLTHK